MAIRFAESSEANREDWRGGTGSLMPMSASRYASCAYAVLLVEVWVIVDRPPNNPLLRKEGPFTSSYRPAEGSREVVNCLS